MAADNFISFPEGYLGPKSMKFPLLANDADFFAINKPAGVSCFQHEWTLGGPDISMALKRELLGAKPQLFRLGIEGVYRIFNLDAEVSGVLMYAKNATAEAVYRNACGSRQFVFRYHLLVSTEVEERELDCDLPLAKHFQEQRVLVSHKTGKKCETHFRYLRNFGQYQLWEAESRDHRMHQIRVHAAECGLNIVGEDLYAEQEKIFLSRIKKDYRKDKRERFEKPLYDALCIHLVQIDFDIPGKQFEPITAPIPKRFGSLLKRLDDSRGYGSR